MVNFKTITRIIGILLLLETAMLLACSGISLYYQDEALTDFWKSAGIAAGVGILLVLLGKGSDGVLTRRDGYVLVSLAWIAFSFFGMLPFYISGYIPDITNAFFETMSGFTSTGATILDNIESLPHGLLFWRSMTQWIGGLGIIMFTIAVLPIFGVSGLQDSPPKPADDARQSTPPYRHHSQMDMVGIHRDYGNTRRTAYAGGHELVRQHLPRFCHYGNRRILDQTGKHSLLSFALYRIRHIYLYVHFRYQLYTAATSCQPEIQESVS